MKKCNHGVNDGTFFIDLDNYLKFFSKTHICKAKDSYEYKILTLDYDPKFIYNFIEIKVNTAGQCFFIVNQKNTRIYKNTKNIQKYENQFLTFSLFRIEGAEYVFVGSVCANDNRIYIEHDLEKPASFIGAISYQYMYEENLTVNWSKMRERHHQMFEKKNTHDGVLQRNKFTIGVYSADRNPSISIYTPKLDYFASKMYHDPIIRHAFSNPQKHNFVEEEEKDSWRSIYFPKDQGGIGYIVFQNLSRGYIYEKLTFTKYVNLNVTSLLDEHMNDELGIQDDLKFGDLDDQIRIDFLVTQGMLGCKAFIISNPDPSQPISEDNPFVMQVIIRPKDHGVFIFEKTAETSGFEVKSEIMFNYPMVELLRGSMFPSKKNKIKYVHKFLEIIEDIIEHTSGVVFKYTNNTKNMKLGVHLKFTNLDNLRIKQRVNYDMNGNIVKDADFDDTMQKEMKIEKVDRAESEIPIPHITDHSTEMYLIVNPDEVVIVELGSVDKYKLYSYLTDINYNVNYCKDARGGFMKLGK